MFYLSRTQHKALHLMIGASTFIGFCVHVRDHMSYSAFLTCEPALNEAM